MKTLEPILIDTSLRFGQADIMQWFPEVTEEDAQSALVAAQEAADAELSDHWPYASWLLDSDPVATRRGNWTFTLPHPTELDAAMWRHFRAAMTVTAAAITDPAYQKPLIEHILREIEETRTREAVEQGRW